MTDARLFHHGLPASTRLKPIDSFRERRSGRNRTFVRCECECGQSVTVEYYQLISGKTRSCGCLAKIIGSRNGKQFGFKRKHGESSHAGNTSEYRIWNGIRGRCHNPNDPAFKYYGGRGISVYPGWRESYAAFLGYVGRRPSPKYSLDRYPNNDGNYEPGNVRWATAKQQINNSRVVTIIQFRGESRNITEWAEKISIPVNALYFRLRKGWPIEKALTTPLRITSRSRA